jgi:hypothetical protein
MATMRNTIRGLRSAVTRQRRQIAVYQKALKNVATQAKRNGVQIRWSRPEFRGREVDNRTAKG